MNYFLLAQSASNAALVTFLIYILGVFVIAWLANKLMRGKNFLSEYFLGSRGLGVWAFALTFAATSASGGSFTGFPSKVYMHGWIMALWIGSYMVVPICAMGLIGKRINQMARLSGAITIPDVFRDRFRSPIFGLASVALIVFFMSFNLVEQFKSGSEILKTLLQDVELFQSSAAWVEGAKSGVGWLRDVDAGYLLCLCVFAVSVIVYTTYGGFHAVVWTDVMQGIVMVLGVVIMLPLALWQVGGLSSSTERLAELTPPRVGMVQITMAEEVQDRWSVTSPWFAISNGEDKPRLFRISGTLSVPEGTMHLRHLKVVEITAESQIDDQLKSLKDEVDFPPSWGEVGDVVWLNSIAREKLASSSLIETCSLEYAYGAGKKGSYVRGPGPLPPQLPKNPGTLIVHSAQPGDVVIVDSDGRLVDERQSETNVVSIDAGTYQIMGKQGVDYTEAVSVEVEEAGVAEATVDWSSIGEGEFVSKGRRNAPSDSGFLPLSLAVSFFFMWAISGTGQPSTMVRLMAFKNARTLRYAMITVAIYYSLIYFPLIVIFCCSRLLLPGMDLESDRIMPQMAVTLTANAGQPWLAGLLVAAPFAAVMSTVDSFLLVISSALVRDVYQRNINAKASQSTIKTMTYVVTLLIGLGALLGSINPPQFLQDIIVYTGSGLAACFLAPVIFAAYWPRANLRGCLAGMFIGFLAHLAMYVTGMFTNGSFFRPYRLFDFNPIIVGLVASFAATYVVTKMTAPPDDEVVRLFFHRKDKAK
jgi:Na+/pantothenate symporter